MRNFPFIIAAAIGGAYAAPQTMRAVVAVAQGTEGDFSKLMVIDAQPVPAVGHGQVLIRVAASSVNPIDWKLYSDPSMKNMTKDHPKVLGFDLSGVVEEVGVGCTRLKKGDAVWADLGKGLFTDAGVQLGAWADFAVADESQVGLKPTSMSFSDAATLPLVGLTDFQALRKAGLPQGVRRDFVAVVTSGAGGTGTPAIQMLKAYGAKRIITSASLANAALLKSLGATDVIDYHKATIWDSLDENSVDVVYDNFGAPNTSDAAMKVLRPGGVFVFLPGKGGDISKHPKAGVRQINFGICDASKFEDLDSLRDFVDSGLKAVVDQSFALGDITKALNVSLHGHVVGKIGLNVQTVTSNDVLVV